MYTRPDREPIPIPTNNRRARVFVIDMLFARAHDAIVAGLARHTKRSSH